MPSIFQQGENLLHSAYSFAGCSVSYSRNGITLATSIPAKLGRTVFRYDTPAGITVRTEQRDFILRFSDINTEPQTGDEILFDNEIFVVSAPNSEPCWKWHTRLTHAEIRIHTKSAGSPPAPPSSSSSSSSAEPSGEYGSSTVSVSRVSSVPIRTHQYLSVLLAISFYGVFLCHPSL